MTTWHRRYRARREASGRSSDDHSPEPAILESEGGRLTFSFEHRGGGGEAARHFHAFDDLLQELRLRLGEVLVLLTERGLRMQCAARAQQRVLRCLAGWAQRSALQAALRTAFAAIGFRLSTKCGTRLFHLSSLPFSIFTTSPARISAIRNLCSVACGRRSV